MNKEKIMRLINEISSETRFLIKTLSEQKVTQQSLETDYIELNEIFNKVMDAVMVIDRDHSILKINESMARLWGGAPGDMTNCKCYEIFGDENCFTANCPIDLAIGGAEVIELESEKKVANGTEVSCLITAVPLKNSDGTVKGIVKTIKDITKRKRAEEKISYLAHHDHLTGLPNRGCFLDRLCLEIAHAKRNKKLLAVIFIDLNDFKAINDTLGHDVGDTYLIEASKRLMSVLRESDTVARIGGDEFTVLLTGLNRQKDAVTFAKRLIAAFEEPWFLNGREFQVSASMGIALYPGDGENPYTLLKKADKAMYRAKKEGELFKFYNFYLNQ